MELVRAIDNICLILGDEDGSRAPAVSRLLPLVWGTLNLGVSPNVKTCCTEVDFHLMVALPTDAIKATKVGVIRDGCVLPLLHSKRTRTKRLKIKCKEEINPQTKFHNPSHSVLSFLGDIGEVYWLPDSDVAGYYRVEDGHLMLSSSIESGETILLEYLSSDKDLSYIPDEIFMVVAQRVAMQYWGSTNPQKAKYHEEQFKTELRQYNRVMRDEYDLEAIAKALSGNYSTAVR